MIKNPTVDIVLPVFNGMPYLPEAVGSVLAQTHSNWRLHCIDDASRDSSWDYLSGIADERISCSRLPRNVGLYGVLNLALQACVADFIVILMQDDLLHPDHLERFCGLAGAHPEAQVFWGAEDLVRFDGSVLRPGPRSGRVEVIPPSIEAVRSALMRGCIWTISGSFTTREHLVREGFRPDLPHASDWRFILRSLAKVQCIYVEDSLVSIRIHDGQATNRHADSLTDLIDYREVIREASRDLPEAVDLHHYGMAIRKLRVRAIRRAIRLASTMRFRQAARSFALAIDM